MYVAKEQLIQWKNDTTQYGKEKYSEAKKYLEKVQREVENEEQAIKQKAEKLLKEVLVGFEGGNAQLPYVSSSNYNGVTSRWNASF